MLLEVKTGDRCRPPGKNFLFLCYEAGDFYDYVAGFYHRWYGYEFVTSVEIMSSGENVGTRQSFEREACAVGPASDGNYHWSYADIFHGFFGKVDDIHDRLYFFAHVVVLIFDVETGAVGEFFVDFMYEVSEFFFTSFEAIAVVVAYNVAEGCFLDAAFARNQVVKTFIAFGMLGCFPAR